MRPQRIPCWLAPMLAWAATLVAGMQVAVHFWFPPLIEDSLMALDTALQGMRPDASAWSVTRALAGNAWVPLSRLVLPSVAVVVAAHLVASGVDRACRMATRRTSAKSG